jgi:dihydroorotate dehydrogenase (fumarate)
MQTDVSYLGLRLAHPFIAGASPYGHHLDAVRRLEDAGCAAVVLHSLFEEQITAVGEGRIHHMDPEDEAFEQSIAAFPPAEHYALGPDAYAEHLQRVKRAVHIPIIGSLNGTSRESWLKFARVIEQAGADALEVNLYEIVSDFHTPGATVEDRLVGIVRELGRMIRIPVAVKLSPFYTSMANVARQLDAAGAAGLVLFNRFYQADIDIDAVRLETRVELSTSTELLLRIRWLANLYGRIRPSLAITGGVSTPTDGIKAILAGADAVQLVSALLRHGPEYVGVMRRGLEDWMTKQEFSRIDEIRGLASLRKIPDAGTLERAAYITTLTGYPDPLPGSRAEDTTNEPDVSKLVPPDQPMANRF